MARKLPDWLGYLTQTHRRLLYNFKWPIPRNLNGLETSIFTVTTTSYIPRVGVSMWSPYRFLPS